MIYELYPQNNNLYLRILKGGYVGYITIQRLDGDKKGTQFKVYISRANGGTGNPIITGMQKIRYNVILPTSSRIYDNRTIVIPPTQIIEYTLYSPINGVPKLTSGYGWRNGKFHRGQDYSAPPIKLQALKHMRVNVRGTLYRYYEPNGFGRYVYIKCDDGFGIVAAHLEAYGVPSGTRVNSESIIGYVGSTGNSTGVHAHIELHKKFGAGFTPNNAVPFKFNAR